MAWSNFRNVIIFSPWLLIENKNKRLHDSKQAWLCFSLSERDVSIVDAWSIGTHVSTWCDLPAVSWLNTKHVVWPTPGKHGVVTHAYWISVTTYVVGGLPHTRHARARQARRGVAMRWQDTYFPVTEFLRLLCGRKTASVTWRHQYTLTPSSWLV